MAVSIDCRFTATVSSDAVLIMLPLMRQCKARKLVWRVNKAIAKDLLPTEPLDPRLDPWWLAHVVNLGEDSSPQLTVLLKLTIRLIQRVVLVRALERERCPTAANLRPGMQMRIKGNMSLPCLNRLPM